MWGEEGRVNRGKEDGTKLLHLPAEPGTDLTAVSVCPGSNVTQ